MPTADVRLSDRRPLLSSSGVTRACWIAVLAVATVILLTRPGTWFDLHWVFLGAVNFVHGRPPYAVRGLDCIPSTLLYVAPLGLVDEITARVIMRVVGVLCLLVAVYASLTLVEGRKPRLAWMASVTMALVLFEPARSVLRQGNIGVLATALVCVALVYAAHGRWTTYGWLLGIALSVKPVAIALVLLPLLYRRPRAALTAALIPLVLVGVGLATMADPVRFFTHAGPYLLHSGQERAFSHGSLYNLLNWYGAPAPLTAVVRVAAAGVMLAAAVARHRSGGPEGLRIAETSGCLVLATLLSSSTALSHYLLFALPLMVGVLVRGSAMRNPVALVGLVLVASPYRWVFTPLRGHIHEGTVVWAIGMILISAAVAWQSLRTRDRDGDRLREVADDPRRLATVAST